MTCRGLREHRSGPVQNRHLREPGYRHHALPGRVSRPLPSRQDRRRQARPAGQLKSPPRLPPTVSPGGWPPPLRPHLSLSRRGGVRSRHGHRPTLRTGTASLTTRHAEVPGRPCPRQATVVQPSNPRRRHPEPPPSSAQTRPGKPPPPTELHRSCNPSPKAQGGDHRSGHRDRSGRLPDGPHNGPHMRPTSPY